MTLENFPSKEIKMLIIKEGMMDNNELVREACIKFIEKSILDH